MSEKAVSDLMHKGIIACRPETPMNEVVRIFSDQDVPAVVVIDDENLAVGILSHPDIIRLYGEDLSRHTAREVMSPAVEIGSDEPAKTAAERMLASNIYRLLVVEDEGDERRPVGILSATDLVKEMRGSRWIWYMG